MKLDAADKERLRELYEVQLRTSEKVPISWSPAKHRSTQIDTNKTLTGTSDVRQIPSPSGRLTHQTRQSASANQNSSRNACRTARTASKAAEHDAEPASLYKSDYSPGSQKQQQLHQLAATRRGLQATSEWAVLDELEHTIAESEVAARNINKHLIQQQQRQQLDVQVAQHEKERQAVAAAKAADLAAAVADVAAYKMAEEGKVAAAQEAARKLRADQEKQSAAAEAARACAAAKKAREETALLASLEKQAAEAKEAAAAKLAQAKADAQAAKTANEQALQAKRMAAHEQQEKDEELMRETIKTLQRQEEAREAALRAFRDNIAARAKQVGAVAVAENKSRQDRENRLIAANEAKAKAEAEAKHAAELAKRAAMAEDTRASAAAAAAAKAAAQKAARDEQTRRRQEMEADFQRLQLSESMTAAQRKQRNAQYKADLEAQIAEAEARQVLDDIFMTASERELNQQLIGHARTMLGRISHI